MDEQSGLTRRSFLSGTSAAVALIILNPLRAFATSVAKQPFLNGLRELVTYPQKRALMRISTRPVHLETPFELFDQNVITPNDAFFVRYHLADIPLSIDAEKYRIEIKGHVEKTLSLSLEALKALAKPVEIIAVNQCSGNSRGFSNPRVPGAQLGNGSMGNAKWTGIPLKAVLQAAGVKSGAKQVTFRGLDKPVMPTTPNFVKALDIDHAMNGEPMLAWAMNGVDIPMLNGYPLKLIVPGYFGTYWVKHVSEIEVLDHTFDGFFMSTAYRVPTTDCECVTPGTAPAQTKPIGQIKVRSFFTNVTNETKIKRRQEFLVRGIAFDGGAGIQQVELSMDKGKTWKLAKLGEELGKFSFREWTFPLEGQKKALQLMVRATSNSGEVQPLEAIWNPGGYQRNVVESVQIGLG